MEIINLDMTPSTVTPNAHAGQYDASRTIRFMLKNGGVPFTLAGTETITAEITRSDNTEVTVNVANTSSNYVDVVFDDTVCTVKGLYACELRLKDSDGFDIGSKNFALLVQRDPYDNKNVRTVTVGPADICTFETTLAEPYQSVLVNVLATGGNGTPDNPVAINGYTEANITRCGVNFLPLKFYKGLSYNTAVGSVFDMEEATDGTVSGNTVSFNIGSWGRKCMLSNKLPTGIDFRLSMTVTSSASDLNYTEFYLDENLKVTRKYNIQNSGTNRTVNAGFNLNAGECYIAIELGCDHSATITYDSPMLNIGSTASPYTAYTDNTYTIAFGQTVYGGVLDVTRGKLHVTFGNDNLADLNWNYSSADGWFQVAHSHKYPQSGVLCSSYPVVYALGSGFVDKSLAFVNGYLAIKNSDYGSDVNALKTALSGQTLCYELATPFDIDLTPVQISALVGTNNVYSDTNGDTTVKFKDTIQNYIDKKVST